MLRHCTCLLYTSLEKFYDDIEKVEVSLKVVKPETAENKEAGVKVLVPVSYTHLDVYKRQRYPR